MSDQQWKEVATSDDIAEGAPFSVDLSDEESVLLIRRDGKLYAWGNACPHVGCPLSWGQIHGDEIICACHNARFDVSTGRMTSPPSLDDLTRYEVTEESGAVRIGPSHAPSISMPRGEDDRTVVIVGAGAGGNAAAEELRRGGFAGRIVMITEEEARPYDRTLLSKFFLAKDMVFDDIAIRSADFYTELNIELLTGRRVAKVLPERHGVVLNDGNEVSGDFLILATGSTPKKLPVPGAELSGCFTLRTYADGAGLQAAAQKAKRAVVVGASFIGTETAAYLRDRGIDVTIVAPEEVPFESIFGREVGMRFVKMHTEAGVQVRLGTGISKIVGNGSVEGVELSDGTSLPADLVVVGVGVTPVVDYAEDSGLVKDGAITVNEYLVTSTPGVYAVGDIARVVATPGGSSRNAGVGKQVEHWVVAQRHGQHAARSITGSPQPLPWAPFFWTRQFETSFAYVGYALEYDNVRIKGDVENGKFLIGYFYRDHLAAVGTMGMSGSLVRYGILLDQGHAVTEEEFVAGA